MEVGSPLYYSVLCIFHQVFPLKYYCKKGYLSPKSDLVFECTNKNLVDMPKPCAVPKCSTGSRCLDEKCSVFRVPQDAERYKKWSAIIPGLKQSHFVCERHFEEHFILREWKKYDATGQLMAQATYIKPKLDKLAVPLILNNNESAQEILPISQARIDETRNEVLGTLPLQELSDVNHVDSALMDVTDVESTKNASHKGVISQLLIMDEHFLQQGSPIKTEITVTDEFAHMVPQESLQPEIVALNESVKCKNLLISEVAAVVSNSHDYRSASVPVCSIEVATSNEDHESCILIPQSWDIKKLSTNRGWSIVFVKWVTKQENGIEIPVVEKSVVIATGGSLHYFVYGRTVDPKGCKLDSVLSQITLLPKILEKFRHLNICAGIGALKVLHFSADSAFKDHVDRWRRKECTLVSKHKRCNGCLTMRKVALKRERILKENRPLTRINDASYQMDQKKLLAQRKKIRNEKRSKNRAKYRVQILMQSLKTKQNELASIRAETLEERCSSLEISAAQKVALTEIIAASKKVCNNRRYTEEWIMLCMVMNIRSPGYYEFLRKNNVLPLPCRRTIRSYFSLINMKCGFDEQF